MQGGKQKKANFNRGVPRELETRSGPVLSPSKPDNPNDVETQNNEFQPVQPVPRERDPNQTAQASAPLQDTETPVRFVDKDGQQPGILQLLRVSKRATLVLRNY